MNTFIDVINSYIQQIENTYVLPIFELISVAERVPATPPETGTEIVFVLVPNDGKEVMISFQNLLKTLSNNIFKSFDIMFNSYVHSAKDTNIILIPSYGEMSRNFYDYNIDNKIFETNLAYANSVGKLYTASQVGTTGLFLNVYKTYIDSIVNICYKYQDLYNKFPYDPTPTPGPTPEDPDLPAKPKVLLFWEAYIGLFEFDLEKYIEIFNVMNDDFIKYFDTIQNYIALPEQSSKAMSLAQNFLSAEDIDELDNKKLGEIFSLHSESFSIYSNFVDMVYKIYVDAMAEFDIYKESLSELDPAIADYRASEDKTKMLTSFVLDNFKFFELAEEYDEIFTTIINTYNLR